MKHNPSDNILRTILGQNEHRDKGQHYLLLFRAIPVAFDFYLNFLVNTMVGEHRGF